MNRIITVLGIVGVISGAATTGCAPKNDAAKPATPAAAVSREQKPAKAKPPEISASVQGLDLTLTDAKGNLVARVKAEAGAVGASEAPGGGAPGGGTLGVMSKGVATVYENGKPTATLTADTMTADREKRLVTGTGNVVARSLARPDAPMIRADTMTWRHDAGEIRGKGNVLITRKPDWQFPGDSFVADTQIKSFRVESSEGDTAKGSL